MIEHLQEQRRLVAEGGVEARLGQPGLRRDVVERGRLIALAPENLARSEQDIIWIECAGPCHGPYVTPNTAFATERLSKRQIQHAALEHTVARAFEMAAHQLAGALAIA